MVGSSALRRLFPILVAASFLPALLLLRLEARLRLLDTTRDEDVYLLPSPGALSLLSLGHREAAASVLWTRALAYFGEQFARRGRLEHLEDHVDAVIALDPDFHYAYEWAAIVSVYNSRGITRQAIELSNHWLERGAQHFPNEPKFLELLAFNYAVEMPVFARDAAEKDDLRRRAAELYERASRLPGAETASGFMAAELYTRTGQRALAERHLGALFAATDDEGVRRRAADRLAELIGDAAADESLAEARRLLEAWRREYPYMPPDLYFLVGPKVLERAGAPVPSDDADAGPDAGLPDTP